MLIVITGVSLYASDRYGYRWYMLEDTEYRLYIIVFGVVPCFLYRLFVDKKK